VLDASALLGLLVKNQVEFVVIGGLAMISHGSAHITEDLDICYSRNSQNIARIEDAFASIHPYLRGVPEGLPFRFDALTIQAGLNFTLRTDFGPVDLLGEVSGVGDYDQALRQSQEEQVYGFAVRILTLDALIASKKAADRLRDRNHILELEELKKLRDNIQ
jgi:hypothetical protein